MFKIPQWEDDVPKSKVDFSATKKPKNRKSGSGPNNNEQSSNSVSPKKGKNVFQKNKTIIKQSNQKFNSGRNINNTNFATTNGQKFLKTKQNGTHTLYNNQQPSQQYNGNISTSILDSNKKKKAKKRKLDTNSQTSITNTSQTKSKINPEIPAKKKKLANVSEEGSILIQPSKKKKINHGKIGLNDDNLHLPHQVSKVDKKKEKLKQMLQMENNRNHINISGDKLRQRMMDRLKSAQFRFLNEKLYTSSGAEAQQLFQSDPQAFQTYHEGYQQQVKKWPVNPLDLIIKRISKMPKSHLIADMGCGEAALSRRVSQPVRSFDLVARDGVEACDMAHTPLLASSVDVAVYCLALMGTNLTQYLLEANRVLKVGGHLLIAEVESRFEKVDKFIEDVQKLGFKLKNLDKSHTVFFFMEFTKVRDPPAKKSKMPLITLKPCLYKRR